MFKGMPNLQSLMKQAQKMQEQMLKAQEEFKAKTFETSVGGGMVTVIFNGAGEMVSIKINPEVVDPNDIETLQDLILSAVNAGIKKSQEMWQQEVEQITGGLNIPGLTGFGR